MCARGDERGISFSRAFWDSIDQGWIVPGSFSLPDWLCFLVLTEQDSATVWACEASCNSALGPHFV